MSSLENRAATCQDRTAALPPHARTCGSLLPESFFVDSVHYAGVFIILVGMAAGFAPPTDHTLPCAGLPLSLDLSSPALHLPQLHLVFLVPHFFLLIPTASDWACGPAFCSCSLQTCCMFACAFMPRA